MDLLLLACGAGYVAGSVWLLVRWINRRERWVKRVAWGMILLPILYILSFGPACWITSRMDQGRDWGRKILPKGYAPIVRWFSEPEPAHLVNLARWYSRLGAAENWNWEPGFVIPHMNRAPADWSTSVTIELEYWWTPDGPFGLSAFPRATNAP
jgi:hypothetical protein